MYRRGFWRQGRARRSPDARQDLADNSRRQDHLRRHPESVRRDALSFAAGRWGDDSAGAGSQRPHGGKRNYGTAAQAARSRGRAVSSRIDPYVRGQASAAKLSRQPRQERNRAMSGLHDALQALIDGRSLTDAEAELAIGEIMDGGAHDAVVGAFLVALKIKGAEADELAGAVRAMLQRALPLNLRDGEVLDTCGTGGDGASTFNISTGAALIAAAAGVLVAKHGNRAISGTVGTADVLEAMGVKIDCAPDGLERCLDAAGCCHIFAQAYHPAFRKIASLRRDLRIRTIFNLMGAIGNPARPRFHLLGVADDPLMKPMARALRSLGTRHAMVVHGGDGIDEIAIAGPTRVIELRAGDFTEYEITPESLGVARGDARALVVRNLDDAVRVLRGALDGGAGPAQDVLALNGGAAINVGGKAPSLKQGVDTAREIIATGRGLKVLDQMRRASNGLPTGGIQ